MKHTRGEQGVEEAEKRPRMAVEGCVGGGRWQTDAVQNTLRTVETDSVQRKKKG